MELVAAEMPDPAGTDAVGSWLGEAMKTSRSVCCVCSVWNVS